MAERNIPIEIDDQIEYPKDPPGVNRIGYVLRFQVEHNTSGLLDLEDISGLDCIKSLREHGYVHADLRSELSSYPQPKDETLDASTYFTGYLFKLIVIKPEGQSGPHQAATYAICHPEDRTNEAVSGEYADEDGEVEPVYAYDIGGVFDKPGTTGYSKVEVTPEEWELIEEFGKAVHAAAVDKLAETVN